MFISGQIIWTSLSKSNEFHLVSSRHLERLKGLLAKTEGTVALGGRSNDEIRFDTAGLSSFKMRIKVYLMM